jgi:nucleoside-diphosphate-sugar epimerase
MRNAPVLVTGATGLVGAALLDLLEERGWTGVVGVSRRGSASRNVLAWEMGVREPPVELRRTWDVVVNAAADTRWTQRPEDARRANVASVEALASLVGPGTHVVHVSTAYAVGRRGGGASPALEDYRNSYEWSKAHAERYVRALFPRLTIVRPPLIVGRRTDGRAARFSGMYTLLRGVALSSVPAVVALPDAYLDVIPVDDLAALIADVACSPGHGAGEVVTLAGGDRAPRVERALEVILGAFNAWRARRALPAIAMPRLVSPDSWSRFLLPFARQHLSARQLRILDLLAEFQPYLALTEPLHATHPVGDVESCLRASVRHWADANARVASLTPRPWTTVV